MDKQDALIKAIKSVERIGFHTNGISKSFQNTEMQDILIVRIGLGIEGNTSYNIEIMGTVKGVGSMKDGKCSLTMSVNRVKKDNFSLED